MKVFVEISEVHKSIRELEVPDEATPEQIRTLAREEAGEAYELNLEYSHTLDPEHWNIRRENGQYL